jgi:hypothetical protein
MPANQQNLNDATPAPPSGKQNVKWQTDASAPRNDSANVPSTGGAAVKTSGYQIAASDCGKLIVFEGTANATFELPAVSPFAQWDVFVENNAVAAGSPPVSPVLTLTPLSGSPPSGANLDGLSASITLQPGQGVYIATDGTNYFTERGLVGTGLKLETNGTPNGSQALLDLIAGSGVTLADNGLGGITVGATAISPAVTIEVNAIPVSYDYQVYVNGLPKFIEVNGS